MRSARMAVAGVAVAIGFGSFFMLAIAGGATYFVVMAVAFIAAQIIAPNRKRNQGKGNRR